MNEMVREEDDFIDRFDDEWIFGRKFEANEYTEFLLLWLLQPLKNVLHERLWPLELGLQGH